MKTRHYPLLLVVIFVAACGSNSAPSTPAIPSAVATCEPVGLGNTHTDATTYQSILERYLDVGFPGITAAVYTPEKGLWVGAAGFSDVANKVPMQPCNVFFSGSVAKTYTVTAAMALYETGMLDLNDIVAWHLPAALGDGLPNAKLANVRQLLNHAAGMPDHDDDEALGDYVDTHAGHLPSAEEQLSYLFDDPPRFAPGESADYSSAHTLTLSLVLDSVSGVHHSNLISSEIIGKLGLTETFYKNEPGYPSPKNLVRGYLGAGSQILDISEESKNYCADSQGDAGIIASAHDYYRFLRGLVEGAIVAPATFEQMTDPQWIYDDGIHALGFGLGLFVIKKDNVVAKIGHSGITAGGMAHMYYYPETGSYIVVLTNTLIDDDVSLLTRWGAELLVGTGTPSIMADLEALLL